MLSVPKNELYELIDALPDTETLAAKRYLEFSMKPNIFLMSPNAVVQFERRDLKSDVLFILLDPD